jgi:hypothetical protein
VERGTTATSPATCVAIAINIASGTRTRAASGTSFANPARANTVIGSATATRAAMAPKTATVFAHEYQIGRGVFDNDDPTAAPITCGNSPAPDCLRVAGVSKIAALARVAGVARVAAVAGVVGIVKPAAARYLRYVCCADGCEHTGGRESPAERHDDERLLGSAEATTSLLLTRADPEYSNLIETGPGRSVLYERTM